MDIRDVINEGCDQNYLEHYFFVERYVWMSLSYDMVAIIAMDGEFIDVNHPWEGVVGFSPSEMRGNYLLEYMDFDDRERILAQLQSLITSDIESKSLDFRFLCKDGSYCRLHWNVIYSPDHNLYYCTVKDVTQRDMAEVLHAAYHDVLTGLPNRLFLTDNLPNFLTECDSTVCKLGALFLDLDGFKAVNDTYGHAAGDILLKGVAGRLTKCIKETDTVARLGGDEFVVLLKGLTSPDEAAVVAQRIIDTLSQPFAVEGVSVQIGVSIGIALYPEHGDAMDDLLQSADEAMYSVKHAGKNNFSFVNETAGTEEDTDAPADTPY